jgi:sulfate permease, SulP family
MADTTLPPRRSPPEFLPKIVTVLREGYAIGDLRADAMAGLTVAIVALPLSMAIAIASGVGPERGLFTAIVGGFLVSAFGGSRFQIGGPAGAFIVLVAACVGQIGLPGLLLATLLSGVFLALAGVLRLGTYVRYIPYPVTLGFTAGIAVIIFSSQIKDLFGLTLTAEPSAVLPKVEALWLARGSVTPAAIGVALGTMALILGIKRLRPNWPNLLVAVTLASLAVYLGDLPVQTIGSRFGDLPRVPPAPSLPPMDQAALLAALPWALKFTLLGAIESLLSAVVADGMSGARHRSNAELLGQGLANVGSALFGGICVTGTIARTATNVRAGSRGPVSGMLHAVFVLAFMLVAAPLASHIPLAALAAVLAIVAWNMAEKEEIWTLLRVSRSDALVLVVTFLLVVFRDLSEGIVVGFALGGLVFIRRMSEVAGVEPEDAAPDVEAEGRADRVIVHLHGPFFFGAAAQIGHVLDQIAVQPRTFVLDFTDVAYVDSSGAHALVLFARKLRRKGEALVVIGANDDQRRMLAGVGLGPDLARYVVDRAALG